MSYSLFERIHNIKLNNIVKFKRPNSMFCLYTSFALCNDSKTHGEVNEKE